MGSVAVFLDSLDLRSYNEQGFLLESGLQRPPSEEHAVQRILQSFFDVMFHLMHAGFYKRSGTDLSGVPDRWYLPMISIMHFGAMILVIRRRLNIRRPSASLISPETLQQSLVRDFSKLFPSHFVQAFEITLSRYREGQPLLDMDVPEFNILFQEDTLDLAGEDDILDLFDDDSCVGWIPGTPLNLDDIRLSGIPSPFTDVQPHPYLQNIVELSKFTSAGQKRPCPTPSENDGSAPDTPVASSSIQLGPSLEHQQVQVPQEGGAGNEGRGEGTPENAERYPRRSKRTKTTNKS